MDLKVSEILSAKFNEITKVKEQKIDDEFSFTLTRISNEDDLVKRLEGLIGKITTQGDLLVKHLDIKDMRDYRALIAEFMNEVVSNSHKFSRENFLDRRGRHRVYGIVKMVNKNLDELAQELLKKEKNSLDVLEKTDAIKGLLLDIIV